MGILTATRPWSFTAAGVPILITAKLEGKLTCWDTARLLAMGILVQTAGNLVNSYFDYVKEIDTKEAAGDTTIVDGHIDVSACLPISAACIGGATLLTAQAGYLANATFRNTFLCGVGLSVFYTAPPFYLKYHLLGDLTIIASFGPVLMQACAAALTGSVDAQLYAYCVPISLLTEGILWANNARDIEADSKAGISTFCSNIGFAASKKVYSAMIYGAYAACALIAATRRQPGLLLPFLTLPGAIDTCNKFKEGKAEMQEGSERCAQVHLPFGLMMLAGLCLDDKIGRKLW